MVKRAAFFVVIFMLICSTTKAQSIEGLFKNSNKRSFETILNLAKEGNVKAMYYTGLSYEIGCGVKLNYKKAFIWYKRAADAGFLKAMYNLAFLYKYGFGTKKDMIQSYKWFYISGHMYECHLDAQQMSSDEIKKAKLSAEKWLKKHGY